VLAGFGHDDFIARQDVGRVSMEQVLAEKADKHLCPWNDRIEPALDRTVTTAYAGPAGDAQHSHASSHGEEGKDDTTELADGRRGQGWLKAL
jgi:hypothetical protein